MIYSLNGTLKYQQDQFIIVDVNGVGYQVYMSHLAQQYLPEINQPIEIFTHHHIREDAQTLFGFNSIDDRDFFILLTSVSGVGPKVGLKLLSTLSTNHIIQAILEGDIVTLTSVSGVGKKMAERLIIELKDKLPNQLTDQIRPMTTSSTGKGTRHHSSISDALRALGYKTDEIKSALTSSQDQFTEDMSLESCIKLTLKYL